MDGRRSGYTFCAPVDVDCEYENAFRESVRKIPEDSKDLAGHNQCRISNRSLARLTFIVNILETGDEAWRSNRGEVNVGYR